MTIRRVFLLLLAPLFLLLAGVNGALLYVWEQNEARHGLENQAVAAAVTTAAFVETSRDLPRALTQTNRAAWLADAVTKAPDLQTLWLFTPGAAPLRLAGPANATAPAMSVSDAAAGPRAREREDRRMILGLAPVGDGRLVVAEVDTAPLVAEVGELKRIVAGLVVGAGVIGVLLAWSVASRIARELARNDDTIAAIRAEAPAAEMGGFAIRETHDLALAVRLMRTSVMGRRTRGRHELARRDRERGEASGAAAHRDAMMPALAVAAGGADIVARILGAASPGAFHALRIEGERVSLVIGECRGDTPSAALAVALAARRFFQAHMASDARMTQAEQAFGLSRSAWLTWSVAGPPPLRALTLLGDADDVRVAAYVARAGGLGPAEMADDLGALLNPSGVVAIVRPASAEAGQS